MSRISPKNGALNYPLVKAVFTCLLLVIHAIVIFSIAEHLSQLKHLAPRSDSETLDPV